MTSSDVLWTVRVATWNAEARTDAGAAELLIGLQADVLLLTEVHPALFLPGYSMTPLMGLKMTPGGPDYAAVAVRHGLVMEVLQSPAVTTAAARVHGVAFVCTVLPWVHAPCPPYVGATQAEQVENAVNQLMPWLKEQGELVWGGHWNHPLCRPLMGFTVRGSDRLAAAAAALGLTVHTETALAQSTHSGQRCHAIDHIASRHPQQHVEVTDGRPHSTHDAYVVNLTFTARHGDTASV